MLRAAGSGTRRGPLAESCNRVKTLSIIADLDVPRNILACFLPRRVDGPVHALDLNRRVERFGQRIIEADTRPPDGLADSQAIQHARELRRGVITPAIGVEYGTGGKLDIPGGHLDRGRDPRR